MVGRGLTPIERSQRRYQIRHFAGDRTGLDTLVIGGVDVAGDGPFDPEALPTVVTVAVAEELGVPAGEAARTLAEVLHGYITGPLGGVIPADRYPPGGTGRFAAVTCID